MFGKRIMAKVAYDIIPLFYSVCLYSFRWQQKRKDKNNFKYFYCILLSGLWHGANWTFIVWGVMQGLLVIWDNLGIVGVKENDKDSFPRITIPKWLGWIFTFGFFNLSLCFFRSDSMTNAFQMIKIFLLLKIRDIFIR